MSSPNGTVTGYRRSTVSAWRSGRRRVVRSLSHASTVDSYDEESTRTVAAAARYTSNRSPVRKPENYLLGIFLLGIRGDTGVSIPFFPFLFSRKARRYGKPLCVRRRFFGG